MATFVWILAKYLKQSTCYMLSNISISYQRNPLVLIDVLKIKIKIFWQWI